MNKVKFKKTLENKYSDMKYKILSCKSGYRLVNIEIEGYEDENLFHDVIIDLENICSDKKIDFQFNKVNEVISSENIYKVQYLVDEAKMKEFNEIWKKYKSDWIKIRRNLINESKRKNKCACNDMNYCKFHECDCLCHEENKRMTPEKWDKSCKNIYARNYIVDGIKKDGCMDSKTQTKINYYFAFLIQADMNYICLKCPHRTQNIRKYCNNCEMMKQMNKKYKID